MEEPNKQVDIRALGEKIARESAFVNLLTGEINNVIVGQSQMVERLMIGLLGGDTYSWKACRDWPKRWP